MAWTELTRRQHAREGNRYASDLSDAEWALIAPLVPPPKTTGRPRTTRLRDVFDAILCMATTGCQWRMLPNDFPPVSTVRGYFYAWRNDGLLNEINRKLVAATRLAEARAAQPTAGIIDSQSVKTTESGGVTGYYAGKRIKGPKLRDALKTIGRWTVQIVRRSDTAQGFEVLPRRWVVERTFAWLGRCRRLSKDWEKSIASAEVWVTIAHIRRVTRHLARI